MLGFRKQSKPEGPPEETILPLPEIEERLRDALAAGDNAAVLAIDLILKQAIYHHASDVYLEPWRDCLALRYRIDGVLHDIARISRGHQERLVARVKVLARLVAYQKEIPQDGRIEVDDQGTGRAMRVSTFPTVHGEKVVIRVLDPQHELMETTSLGFRPEVVASLQELVFRPQGTLLLTGPSSSGKTTTIYALLRELIASTSPSRHIVTIEDPVEYRLDRASQTQANPDQGFTFEVAFRSMLRQDPDVIMVGEIRDPDTARTAVQAGLTGHLVISTIHSGSAAGVFSRLLDMGIEPFLVASSLSGVLAQRLIRVTCPDCAQPYTPDPQVLSRYGLSSESPHYRRGEGCAKCQGIGFKGRTAIGELLQVGREISDLVLTRPLTSVIQEVALNAGMTTLLDHAVEKVEKGITTVEELALAVPPPGGDTRRRKRTP